ncbi:MAG TPA: hypothetical protein VHR39_02615, partial [Propionibacteriaceae bacterium]|nr:hypothetical protein [Propionibacteriaceae bacterium]
RRMRPTTGDMPLIIEPPARQHATTISLPCQDSPTKPGWVESLAYTSPAADLSGGRVSQS